MKITAKTFSKIISFIFVLILSIVFISRANAIKEIELNYDKDATINDIHAGGKAKVRIIGIPMSVEKLMIVPVNSNENEPKLYVTGKNVKDNLKGYLEFNLQMAEIPAGIHYDHSGQLILKSFVREGESYVVDRTSKAFFRPIICPDTEELLCASVEVICRSGQSCNQDERVQRTLKNSCELEKYDGILLHRGACEEP